MWPEIWLGLGLLGALGLAALIVARMAFYGRLGALEGRLVSAAGSSVDHSDLPDAVAALALRVGAQGTRPRIIQLGQVGSMRQHPGGAEMRFKARQVIAVTQAAFVWRADFAPLGITHMADYFVDGAGGLEARLLGAVPLLKFAGGEAVAKGEIMRYLAELPWAPDAIRHNRALEWRVLDSKTLAAAAGSGAGRGEVRFLLDGDGLVVTIEADDRPRFEGKSMVERPWRGRFWAYREFEGRKIPTRGEVSWLLDGTEFVYWRGTITRWTAKHVRAA